jgi:hypothetical protein
VRGKEFGKTFCVWSSGFQNDEQATRHVQISLCEQDQFIRSPDSKRQSRRKVHYLEPCTKSTSTKGQEAKDRVLDKICVMHHTCFRKSASFTRERGTSNKKAGGHPLSVWIRNCMHIATPPPQISSQQRGRPISLHSCRQRCIHALPATLHLCMRG